MSEKGVVGTLKNRERVSGSIFWRHSWHCSAYLSRELSFSKLNSPVRSWDNMAPTKTDNPRVQKLGHLSRSRPRKQKQKKLRLPRSLSLFHWFGSIRNGARRTGKTVLLNPD
ncbi:uncharacterized protein LOC143259498 [Megalopta genalis]|uniref:uncharacterized protein LOC143259498 n=1 Tax=Megalopta genalis TaxID=115081 RepID=UPI003FD15E26